MELIVKAFLLLSAMIILWIWAGRLAQRAQSGNQRSTAFTPMRIAIIAIALSLGSGILLMPFGGDKTSLGYFFESFFLHAEQDDSWLPMQMAVDQLRQDPAKGLYSELFFNKKVKFQYPTTSLILWDMVQRATGLSWPNLVKWANILSWALLLAGGLASGLLLRNAWHRVNGSQPSESRLAIWGFLCVSMGVGLAFYPLTASLYFGQVQTALSFLAIAALLAWQTGRKKTAGFLIGICCTFKPQWIVALAWGFFHKEFGFAGMVMLVFGLFGICAGALYGFFQYFDYLPAIQFMSRHGESYWPNQSMNGLMHRLFENGEMLIFQPKGFPPYHSVVHMATLAFAAVVFAAVFFRSRGRRQTEFDFSLVLLTLTIISPIAWEHHYGLIPGLLAAMIPWCIVSKPWGRCTPWALVAIWVLASQNFPFLRNYPSSPWNLAMSHLFFAGLILLGLLISMRLPKEALAGPQRTE